MEWYIPITILPGIGILLMSTSALIVALYHNIEELLGRKDLQHHFITRKIRQLNLLSSAMVGFYVASALMVMAGLSSGFSLPQEAFWQGLTRVLMLVGVAAIQLSLFLLVLYSFRAVGIRRHQFLERLSEKEKI